MENLSYDELDFIVGLLELIVKQLDKEGDVCSAKMVRKINEKLSDDLKSRGKNLWYKN